jgi:tryptophanyl-tRNA synthetase
MARNAKIDSESIPFGLVGYPVLESADILLPRAHAVPVGKDNAAHVELTRDIARRFNNHYGEVFPLPETILSDMPTLIGTDGQAKMSKSLNNAIFLSDSPKDVAKKIKSTYTDPNRVHADTPGTVEGNPIFIYHDAFNPNKEEVEEFKRRYREGKVGDVEVKESLTHSINSFLEPIRERREHFASQKGLVEEIIYNGTLRMNEVANETMKEVRSAMGVQGFWKKISRVARDRQKAAQA